MSDLKTKHFGNKIRTCHLDSDRFNIPNGDVIFPKFGILTRYEDGTVGVSIHYMGEKEGTERYGRWMQEATDQTTIESWAKQHENITSSVEDATIF